MADQRQPFRFRLPWLSAPSAPPPHSSIESQPSRPTVETQTPVQSATTAPIQRPPFRPAGIAPAQPPPSQAQVPQRTEPQPPPPPSRASAEPEVASQPAVSPSRSTTQITRAALPSPSRSAPQTRPVAPSPSRAAPQPRASGTVPSSPSRPSETQPVSGTTPQPRSPSRLSSQPAGRTRSQPSPPSRSAAQVQPIGTTKLQPTIQENSQPTPIATQPPSSLSEKEPKPVGFRPISQEPQPKAQVPSETISNSPNHTPIETSSQLDVVATRPTKVSQTSPPQTLDSNAIGGDAKPNSEERKERKEVVREIIEDEKTSGRGYEEPTKKTITELLTAAASISKTQTKDLISAAFQAKQKPKQEKEESFDRKEAIVATSSSAKQINTASSMHPKDSKTSSISTTQNPSVISNGERLPLHEEVRKDISKYVQKLATGHPVDKEKVSVITLAGENRGASMHLGLESAKKEGYVHIHRGYKLNPDESTEATTDGEGSSKAKRSKDPTTKENPPSRAYVNSNVQSVNNSILFDSFVTENNPGVQLVISHNQEEPIKSNDKPEPLEARKAEFNITPAEKRTYEPSIRRRCLRGLFLESSDSDTDNPDKPRRHGCRFNCMEKDKEKEIGVL